MGRFTSVCFDSLTNRAKRSFITASLLSSQSHPDQSNYQPHYFGLSHYLYLGLAGSAILISVACLIFGLHPPRLRESLPASFVHPFHEAREYSTHFASVASLYPRNVNEREGFGQNMRPQASSEEEGITTLAPKELKTNTPNLRDMVERYITSKESGLDGSIHAALNTNDPRITLDVKRHKWVQTEIEEVSLQVSLKSLNA